jgi:hypothetical protein
MAFRINNITYQSNIVNLSTSTVNTETVTTSTISTNTITTTNKQVGITIEDVVIKSNTIYTGGISLKCDNNDNTIKLITPDILTNSYTMKLPDNMGISGYVLATDGNNSLYWTVGGGGGGGTEFADDKFAILKHTDLTKKLSFDVSAISSNRTITVPDNNIDLTNIPNQTVNTTSSPSFLGITISSIKEKTAGNGVVITSNSSKNMATFKPGEEYLYDNNGVCYQSTHGFIGNVPTGSSNYKICSINFTSSPAIAYLDIYSVIKDGVNVDILSTQEVINYSGTIPMDMINIVDLSKQIGLNYYVSNSTASVIIECAQDLSVSKTYNTNVVIRPTIGSYNVVFY